MLKSTKKVIAFIIIIAEILLLVGSAYLLEQPYDSNNTEQNNLIMPANGVYLSPTVSANIISPYITPEPIVVLEKSNTAIREYRSSLRQTTNAQGQQKFYLSEWKNNRTFISLYDAHNANSALENIVCPTATTIDFTMAARYGWVMVKYPITGYYMGRAVGAVARYQVSFGLGTGFVDPTTTPFFQISDMLYKGMAMASMSACEVEYEFYYNDDVAFKNATQSSDLASATPINLQDSYYTINSLNAYNSSGTPVLSGSGGTASRTTAESVTIQTSETVKWETAQANSQISTVAGPGTGEMTFYGNNNSFEDYVGGSDFYKNSVTIYQDGKYRFRIEPGSFYNTMWWSISSASIEPELDIPPIKLLSGPDNLVVEEKANWAENGNIYTYHIDQQVHNIHINAISKYSSMIYKDILPDGLTFQSGQVRLWRIIYEADGETIREKLSIPIQGVGLPNNSNAAGTYVYNSSTREFTFEFNQSFLQNSTNLTHSEGLLGKYMLLEGETYRIEFDVRVNDDVPEFSTIVNNASVTIKTPSNSEGVTNKTNDVVTNTPGTPKNEIEYTHKKQIDYLWDNYHGPDADNPDTTLDDTTSVTKDDYRLYLDFNIVSKPTDLVIVIDNANSMGNTLEATTTKLKAVQNALTNSMNGKDSFIDRFMHANPANRISIVSFAGDYTTGTYDPQMKDYAGWQNDAAVVLDWSSLKDGTSADDVKAAINGISAQAGNTGHNYGAALSKTDTQLKNGVDNGYQKKMLFFSDSPPTFYFDMDNTDDARFPIAPYNRIIEKPSSSKNGNFATLPTSMDDLQIAVRRGPGTDATIDVYSPSNYYWISESRNNIDNTAEPNVDLIRVFKQKHQNVSIVAVGIGDAFSFQDLETVKAINQLTDRMTAEFPNTVDDVNSVLSLYDEMLTGAKNILIYDKLSQYVKANISNTDIKLTITDAKGQVTTLFENEIINPSGVDQNRVLYNPAIPFMVNYNMSGKSFTVMSNPSMADYELPLGSTLTLSFNVQVTQEAKDFYEANMSYPNVGDLDTDYGQNNTSSEHPGFYSNDEATLSFDYNGTEFQETYDDPVVQTELKPPPPENWMIQKKWEKEVDGNIVPMTNEEVDALGIDSVFVQLYSHIDGDEDNKTPLVPMYELKAPYWNMIIEELQLQDSNGNILVYTLKEVKIVYKNGTELSGDLLEIYFKTTYPEVTSTAEYAKIFTAVNRERKGSVIIEKYGKLPEGENQTRPPLEGVQFQLYDKDGNIIPVKRQADGSYIPDPNPPNPPEATSIENTLTTNVDGKVTIKDLKVNEYKLVETKTVEGYNLLKEPVIFTIPYEIEQGQQEPPVSGEDEKVTIDDKNYYYKLTYVLINNQLFEMPESGIAQGVHLNGVYAILLGLFGCYTCLRIRSHKKNI